MTQSRQEIVRAIIEEGVVAVIRVTDSSKVASVVDAIAGGGVRAIEITMTVPGALDQIANISRDFGPDILLGVGSVRDADTAARAVDAGARYVVSPIFREEIVSKAHEMGVPALPGAFTPTEIATAVRAGADIVKVFPADVVGMPFFKGVLAPMPELKLMPTGGVTLNNAAEWLEAGACAVGIGSALVTKDALANDDFDQLEANARIVRYCIDDYRARTGKVS